MNCVHSPCYRAVRFITCFCHYYNSRRGIKKRVYVKQGEHIGYEGCADDV